jgi:hypothetical protein
LLHESQTLKGGGEKNFRKIYRILAAIGADLGLGPLGPWRGPNSPL